MSLLEICRMIQDSQIGTSIRQSNYFFPVVEGSHVLGLAASVGTILWFDLRTLGVSMRDLPVSEVFGQVRKWMLAGFLVVFVTGILLFWAHAADVYVNTFFRIKMAALLLSGVNAAYFHVQTQRGIAAWDTDPIPPARVRLAGLLSIILWFTVIAAGRLMAYTFGVVEY